MVEARKTVDDATRTVFRACTLCEACCGLVVTVRDNTIIDIRGDAEDPLSRGYLCPKGVANADLVADPDRLRQPLLRAADGETGRWRQASWDEALDAAADGLADVIRKHGPDAVAVYVGNAAAHGAGAALMSHELLGVIGSRRRYTASSLDQQPQHLISHLLFGSPLVLGVPDVDRTDHLLILGGNPAVSNGSIMTAPDMRRRIRAIRDRGGRVVVVDPRRTETARLADEHVPIRPGTDVFLLLGMLHVIAVEGLADLGSAAKYIDGVEEVLDIARQFPAAVVAQSTGIPAAEIERLTREFAAAPSAVAYARLGVHQTAFGTTAHWLLTCLNILTGNLDSSGGLMFPSPAIDLAGIFDRWTDLPGYDRFRSRVGDVPEVAGDLPSATLAHEIRTPGPGQIRALVTIGGNPVLSVPDGRGTDEALAGLDLLVCVDPFLTATARHADVILPPRIAFERDEVEAVFGSLAVHNWARYNRRAVDPAPDTRDDAGILAGLVARLATRVGSPQARARGLAVAQIVQRGQLERLIDMAIRTGPRGRYGFGLNLGRIKAADHGLDLGPLRPSLPGRLFTPGKRIRLDHPALVGDIPRVRAALAQQSPGADGELLLIGRRRLRSNNSWLANSPRLMRGGDPCTVLLHSADALARGIVDGAVVRLTGPGGSIDLPAEVGDDILPGVVAVPHGWGHDRDGVQLRVAASMPGASVNDVTGGLAMDPLSGNAVLQGIPVHVQMLASDAGPAPTVAAGPTDRAVRLDLAPHGTASDHGDQPGPRHRRRPAASVSPSLVLGPHAESCGA